MLMQELLSAISERRCIDFSRKDKTHEAIRQYLPDAAEPPNPDQEALELVKRARRKNIPSASPLADCGFTLRSEDPKLNHIFGRLTLDDLYVWSKHYDKARRGADDQKAQTEAEIGKIKSGCPLAEVSDEDLALEVKERTPLYEFGKKNSEGELMLEEMPVGIPRFYTDLYQKRRKLRQLDDERKQKRDPFALLRDLDETFVIGDSSERAAGGLKAAYLMVYGHNNGSQHQQALVSSKPLQLDGKKYDTATVSMATVGLPLSHTYLILDQDVSPRLFSPVFITPVQTRVSKLHHHVSCSGFAVGDVTVNAAKLCSDTDQ